MTTAPTSQPLLTAEEFYRLPEPPHGGKSELMSGKVVEHMPPGGVHGKLTRRLGAAVGAFTDAHGLGETVTDSGFRLRRDPDTVLGPDVAVVSSEILPNGRLPVGYIDAVPFLVVEVASPKDRRKDILAKVGEYLDAGVARVWTVRERDRTVIVYGQDDRITVVPADGVLTSDDAGFATAGFVLPVADVFR